MQKSRTVLYIIILSQFLCTSMWFAGNAIIDQLVLDFRLEEGALSKVTSSVQLGFILGTLSYSLLGISDRFSPSKVFMLSAIIGGISNFIIVLPFMSSAWTLYISRIMTGFFLAGIYPVGMKIAADHFEKKLGKSLGWLVGALVLGTALPHLLRGWLSSFDWSVTIAVTSAFSILGGILIGAFVADGPYRAPAGQFKINSIPFVFQNKQLRQAAIGYFGHMWELYTFWALIPFFVHKAAPDFSTAETSIISFSIIAIGSIGCIAGGELSQRYPIRKLALGTLGTSMVCGLLFLGALQLSWTAIALVTLFIWGLTVIPDSPMFSTLVAQNSTPSYKGTALTLVNGIGFSITVISIEVTQFVSEQIGISYAIMLLALGPATGLIINSQKQS